MTGDSFHGLTRRIALAGLVAILSLGLASRSVHAKRGPSKAQLKGELTKTLPLGAGQYRVSHRLGALGPGGYAAIGVHLRRGNDCGEHDGVSYPCQWVTPFVLVSDAAGKTIACRSIATTKPAHTGFKWGFAKLKDVDGDGRKELVVIFGYVHHPVTVYERESHRQIAWYDFKVTANPRAQGSLLLGYHMGDSPDEGTVIKTSFRYVKTPSGHRNLRVHTLETGGTQDKRTTRVLRYDAKSDRWIAPPDQMVP